MKNIIIFAYTLLTLISCNSNINKAIETNKNSNPEAHLTGKIPFFSSWHVNEAVERSPKTISTPEDSLSVMTYTTGDKVVFVESISKMTDDPWRVPIQFIEEEMNNESGWGFFESPYLETSPEDIINLIKHISKRFDMTEVEEFNLYPVNMRMFYGQEKGKIKPTYIINIWGADNPLSIYREVKDKRAIDRIRILMDLNYNIIGEDNVL